MAGEAYQDHDMDFCRRGVLAGRDGALELDHEPLKT
jgi:hypothetical protein